MAQRTWFQLGTTAIDLGSVVKVVFDAKDARLFVRAGEALLLTAWSDSRAEIAKLKQFAALDAGWANVQTDDDDEADSITDQRVRLSAVDMAVFADNAGGDAIQLFVSGVYAGRVSGSSEVASVRRQLGIADV